MKVKGFIKSKTVNPKTGRYNQVLKCVTCDRSFTKLCNVLDHVRTHQGDRPYSCGLCHQTFAQRGNRDRHQKMRVCVTKIDINRVVSEGSEEISMQEEGSSQNN